MTAVRGWPETGEVKKDWLDRGTLLAAVEIPVCGGMVKVLADTIVRRDEVRITDCPRPVMKVESPALVAVARVWSWRLLLLDSLSVWSGGPKTADSTV